MWVKKHVFIAYADACGPVSLTNIQQTSENDYESIPVLKGFYRVGRGHVPEMKPESLPHAPTHIFAIGVLVSVALCFDITFFSLESPFWGDHSILIIFQLVVGRTGCFRVEGGFFGLTELFCVLG